MNDKKINIIRNVGQLYLRYGIKSVTMDDVASELGISKKTLYLYFRDKETLVSEVIEYHMENPLFNLNEKGNGNPIDRIFALRNHLINILKFYNNQLEFDLKKLYPHLFRKLHNFKREKIFNDTKLNIEEGINLGIFRKKLDVDFIAKLNVGRMLYTLNTENGIFNEGELSNIDLFDKTIDYHLHGICTEKGLKYYKKQLNSVQNEN